MKIDGYLGRNVLKGRNGDRANAVLTVVGNNLRLILKWVRKLLRKILFQRLAVFFTSPIAVSAS